MSEKIILVTGASAGIGAVTATHLASLGHKVYGVARRLDRLNELRPKGVIPMQLDLCDGNQIKAVVQQIIQEEGRIDVLVNNAGYGCYGPIEDVPIEAARRQFEVNLFGLALITTEILPHMRERKQGRIINVSSVGGVITFPLAGWYNASKFALEGWSDCLRIELYDHNIPVIVIQPGLIKTEFGEVVGESLNTDSKDNAYQNLIDKSIKMFSNSRNASDPMVIAKVIEHGALSSNPKTRYVAGSMARIGLFIRKMQNDMKWTKSTLKLLSIKPKKNYSL